MPKAFTDEEREQIRIRIMEAAIELYHDENTKALSIQELTRRAGIAQGSFYNFWENKDALILDVMKYRASQKMQAARAHCAESLADPAGFLSELIIRNCEDLVRKSAERPIYASSFRLLAQADPQEARRSGLAYQEILEELAAYWLAHGVVSSVDVQGLVNVFIGAHVLFAAQAQFDRPYYEILFRDYVQSATREFIHTEGVQA